MPPAIVADLDAAPVSINRHVAEHYRSRHHRRRRERRAVIAALTGKAPPPGPWLVRFTRLGPRALDSDNLAYAFKAMRDATAEWLGVDDASPDVTWTYASELRRERVPGMHVPGEPRFRVWARVEVRTRPEPTRCPTCGRAT